MYSALFLKESFLFCDAYDKFVFWDKTMYSFQLAFCFLLSQMCPFLYISLMEQYNEAHTTLTKWDSTTGKVKFTKLQKEI